MSEYIGYKDPIGNDMFNMGLTDEEIVRCRDCKHGLTDKEEPGIMCRRACIGEFEQKRTADIMVEPNGYCAWGERR